MRALITGIGGFIGIHLTEHLAGLGWKVDGLDRERRPALARLEAAGSCSVHLRELGDSREICALLEETEPEVLFHLAGLHGGHPAADIYRTNVLGTEALLDGIGKRGRPVRTLIMGSSAAYGGADTAIDESARFCPLTPYGVSKAAADLMGFQVWAATGLPVVRVRPFNIIGPGQGAGFLLPSVASQLVAAERGEQPPVLRLGDLSGHRDFLDVRDLVRALALVAQQGQPGEAYNVCSGVATSVRAAVEELAALAKIQVSIESDPLRTRGANVPYQVGDAGKLTRLTGWKPQVTLSQSLSDLLNGWRS